MSAALCQCGCGRPAPISDRNNARMGYVKGEPHRFIFGHRQLNPSAPYISAGSGRREHVAIAERALGKPMPPRAVVHHVNENGRDNRPCNLVICQDQAYHRLLHQRLRALKACGHADWRPCVYCARYDDPSTMSPRRGVRGGPALGFCHLGCSARYRRELYARRRERAEVRATIDAMPESAFALVPV